ncbi:hypothetical protein LSAT2_012272 [Lamellibrachia satsuma]|nr:hypothetical protein LSAT2_012272 [Lamellibrachia satsuma]
MEPIVYGLYHHQNKDTSSGERHDSDQKRPLEYKTNIINGHRSFYAQFIPTSQDGGDTNLRNLPQIRVLQIHSGCCDNTNANDNSNNDADNDYVYDYNYGYLST